MDLYLAGDRWPCKHGWGSARRPEWDWVVRKVDIRGAVNIYFSLLMAERYVLDQKKVRSAQSHLSALELRLCCCDVMWLPCRPYCLRVAPLRCKGALEFKQPQSLSPRLAHLGDNEEDEDEDEFFTAPQSLYWSTRSRKTFCRSSRLWSDNAPCKPTDHQLQNTTCSHARDSQEATGNYRRQAC